MITSEHKRPISPPSMDLLDCASSTVATDSVSISPISCRRRPPQWARRVLDRWHLNFTLRGPHPFTRQPESPNMHFEGLEGKKGPRRVGPRRVGPLKGGGPHIFWVRPHPMGPHHDTKNLGQNWFWPKLALAKPRWPEWDWPKSVSSVGFRVFGV